MMTEKMSEEDEKLVKKLKFFIRLVILAIPLALVIGGVGGWLVYESAAPGSEILGIELLLPGILATIINSIALVIIKKSYFKDKEEFLKAGALLNEQQAVETKG
ncbi:MAG: ABC-type spermidine/putrescine transport system permease subunit II [Planctomycetota bacterium]|jgi:ABC-type spermidine/putrescine transport system permease subunit II